MGIHKHPSFIRIIKPWNQGDQGRFSAAGGTDDADGLARADGQTDVIEYLLMVLLKIAEPLEWVSYIDEMN